MYTSFYIKWLKEHHVPDSGIGLIIKQSKERVKKYPPVHSFLYPILALLAEYVFPFLLLFKVKRASKLSSNDFDIFLNKLKSHPISYFQVLGTFVIAPLLEHLYEDEGRRDKFPYHPLRKYDLQFDSNYINETEYLIIGSGAGGAPLAWSLVSKGKKVVLVEKGSFIRAIPSPKYLKRYYVGQGLTLSFNGGMILALAGSTVGGTTSINSGTSFAPLDSCLKNWDKNHGTHFSDGSLQGYINLIEEKIGVCTPDRSLMSASSILFEKGMKMLGRDEVYILPRNVHHECEGNGRCCFGCPKRAKKSTDVAFLPESMERGLKLLIETEVVNVKERDEKVVVTLKNKDGEIHKVVTKKLIISGGALMTPYIIKSNRLGSEYSNAGKGLKIHPATKVLAWFPDLHHGERGIPQGVGYNPPDIENVTIEGIHVPKPTTAMILSVAGEKFRWWMDRYDNLACMGLMVTDKKTGYVMHVNKFPWIFYKLHKDNAISLTKGLILIAEAFFKAGAKKVLIPFSGNINKEFSSIEELQNINLSKIHSKSLILSGFHPQGTAGINRLVDTNLKLKGSKNIYVCDASVMPDSPGVNPQVTIMSLGLRLAEHLETL